MMAYSGRKAAAKAVEGADNMVLAMYGLGGSKAVSSS